MIRAFYVQVGGRDLWHDLEADLFHFNAFEEYI